MTNQITPKQQLDEIVARAYDIFAPYRVQHPIEGSPISVTQEMQEKLASVHMREASGEDLYRYLFKAGSTWGTDKDFKHYLPRFLDLVANDLSSLVWGEMVFSKLVYLEYDTWLADETAVICDFIEALWLYILESYPSRSFNPVEFLTFQIHEDISDYLTVWDTQLEHNDAVYHLADAIYDWIEFRNDSIRSSIDLQWLLQPKKQERIEELFFQTTDSVLSETLSTASQYLYWIREYHLDK